MSTSSKGSVKGVVADAQGMAARRLTRKQRELKQDSATNIEANLLAKIMLNPNLDPEAKRDEMISLMTFDSEATKEENRSKLETFNQFKEYLQEQRKLLNREGIKLQDTEAFAQLQSVIDDMSAATIEFQERVKPLIEILSAVFEIRKNNKITEVYQDIQADKEWLIEQETILSSLEADLEKSRIDWEHLRKEAAKLSADKSLFGFGPIRKASSVRLSEIKLIEEEKAREKSREITAKIVAQQKIITEGRESRNPELAHQKEVLKGFLDLTKDESRDRQKGLVDAAINYVDTSDSRLKGVLTTLGDLSKHAEVVSDSNGMLKNLHIIMDESLKGVNEKNQQIRGGLSKEADGESAIAKMTREGKLSEINEHISLTDDGAIDIANSIGGLTKQSVQIQTYKDTVRNETGSTKRLHLEGVSQMAEQLMSVISAISSAATAESRSVAAANFAEMSEQNQTIISQEVIKNATNVELEAQQISKLVGELEDYGDVLNASSEIASQGYESMRGTVDAIREISTSVQGAIDDFVSDRADAGIASGNDTGTTSEKSKEAASGDFVNPFDKLGD